MTDIALSSPASPQTSGPVEIAEDQSDINSPHKTRLKQEEPADYRKYIDATRFTNLAGKAKWGPRSRNYKGLVKSLRSYNLVMSKKDIGIDEKLELTESLIDQAMAFQLRKQKAFTRTKIKNAATQGSGNKQSQGCFGSREDKLEHINQRIEGTRMLLAGLLDQRSDLKKVRDLEYRKLTGVDMSKSRFLPDNELTASNGALEGGMSRLDVVRYPDGDRVFKKNSDYIGTSTVGKNSGIPQDATKNNLSGRSVASFRLSHALGFNFVPGTNYAVHDECGGTVQKFVNGSPAIKTGDVRQKNDRHYETMLFRITETVRARKNNKPDPGFVYCVGTDESGKRIDVEALLKAVETEDVGETENAQLSVVQGLMDNNKLWTTAAGVTGWSETYFSDPTLQESLANARVFDLLSGQVDRTMDNILFESTEHGTIARGIDNDLSFGSGYSDFSEETLKRIGSFNIPPELPKLISSSTAEKVLGMTQEGCEKILSHDNLTKDEIQAAVSRLKSMQSHIKDIQSGNVPGGRIVEKWDDKTFDQLRSTNDNYVHSAVKGLASRQFFGSPNFSKMMVKDIQERNGKLFAQFLPLVPARDLENLVHEDQNNGGLILKAVQTLQDDGRDEFGLYERFRTQDPNPQ